MLTHVIGAKPATIGNSWGGAANAIYDEYHVSTVPRFSASWTPESGLPLPNRYAAVYRPDTLRAWKDCIVPVNGVPFAFTRGESRSLELPYPSDPCTNAK